MGIKILLKNWFKRISFIKKRGKKMVEKKNRSTLYHNKIAEQYEASYSQPYMQLYFKITWENLKKYLPDNPGGIILDAGGGTGFWARKLAKKGYEIICTDIAEKMLEVGRKLAKEQKLDKLITFEYADIMNMSQYEDDFFDMVITQGDPVGYCDDPIRAINELSRVLKDNGYLSVSIDSFYATIGMLLASRDFRRLEILLNTHVSDFDDGFPQYNFTIQELKELFERNGLEVVEIIGKTIFPKFLPKKVINELLKDEEYFDKILEMELKFNSEPSLIGLSGHIQIIGKKL